MADSRSQPPAFMPLFTRVRGRRILRSSPGSEGCRPHNSLEIHRRLLIYRPSYSQEGAGTSFFRETGGESSREMKRRHPKSLLPRISSFSHTSDEFIA